jgi:hypothetical protein
LFPGNELENLSLMEFLITSEEKFGACFVDAPGKKPCMEKVCTKS